jgi:Cellulase N-terminal ig-like domain
VTPGTRASAARPSRRALTAAAVIAAVLPAACTSHTPPPAATSPPARHPAGPAAAIAPVVRVSQAGYPASGHKLGYAMLPRAATVSFTVAGPAGVVFHGQGRPLGRWNTHYPAVYALDFSGLARPGRYRITVHAAGLAAQSPPFTLASPAALYPGSCATASATSPPNATARTLCPRYSGGSQPT